MLKKIKSIAFWTQLGQKIQFQLHSVHFRKMVLLFLVISMLIFDLAIMNLGENLSQRSESLPQRIPNPWEKNVRELVKGSPMEVMAPYISQKDKKVAAFLVSIAKKESNWGEFSPRMAEKNCYNYWGYRGKGENVNASGYSCFNSPRQAVNMVGKRISDLINESELDTPRKMAVWKCGWNCSWDNPASVEKWIADVDYYYQKFYP